MIDIHTHILPAVDDGSPSLQTSLQMLGESVSQGVTDIILTPHFMPGMRSEKSVIADAFNDFCGKVEGAGIAVRLYLGEEVYYQDEVLVKPLNEQFLTLNGSNYILLEFDEDKDCGILDAVYEVKAFGYLPVIAHVERYKYLSVDDVEEIREMGGKIQVNAETVVGKCHRKTAKLAQELIKRDLVDFIASDFHSFRKNYMAKAYALVEKKFGKQKAEALFVDNAKEMLLK